MSLQMHGNSTLREKMKLLVYQSLYANVKNRLCQYEESLNYDFFTAYHPQSEDYTQQYSFLPTTYNCKGGLGFQGMFNAGNTYLVVAGFDTVVLLLEPEAAFARNLPFIAVLDGHFFKPYLGCPIEFWQSRIEPIALNARHTVLEQPILSTTVVYS